MTKKSITYDQTELYARDLARIYNEEKAKRDELEQAYSLIKQKNQELEKEKEQLRSYAEDFRKLYIQLLDSYSETKEANLETIYRLSIAAEFRDDDTATHLKRISAYSEVVAEAMQFEKEFINLIKLASPMHDVGKIGITDSILLKPGKLTAEEYEQMKMHSYIGHLILKDSKSETLQMADRIAYTHHEKYDGSGYPQNLVGSEIPIEGRIVAVVDVFDALTTKRVYKPALSVDKTLDIMKQGVGTHFDPQVYDAFIESLGTIEDIRESVT